MSATREDSPNQNTYVEQLVLDQLMSGAANAERLLEQGIHKANPAWILQAKEEFTRMLAVYPAGRSKVIRALTALCVLDPKHALDHLRDAMRVDPTDPSVLNNMACVLHKQQGDVDGAVTFYRMCLDIDPTFEQAYLGMADIYRNFSLHGMERQYINAGLKQCPRSAHLWNSLGLNMVNDGLWERPTEMLSHFQKARDLTEDERTLSMISVNEAYVRSRIGEQVRALNLCAGAYRFCAAAYHLGLILVHALYGDGAPHEQPYRDFAQAVSGRPDAPRWDLAADGSALIYSHARGASAPARNMDVSHIPRVGILADDPLGVPWLNPILEGGTAHYYLYSRTRGAPVFGARRVSGFRCVRGLPADLLRDLMVSDKIDVLVDMFGHACGNRMDAIALKPAVAVVSYLSPTDPAFPHVHRVETFLGDRPAICLPGSLEQPAPERRADGRGDGPFTFGCFADTLNISPAAVEAWKRILSALPRARLVLWSPVFTDRAVQTSFRDRFGGLGKRVILLTKKTKEGKRPLSIYRAIDVHLDTFPASSWETSIESLSQDVPVVTLGPPGGSAHQRRTERLLHQAGLHAPLAARTEDDYVEKAVALAERREALPVRETFMRSPAADRKTFVTAWEDALLSAWVTAE
jgi:tetratricopeptide (TPR) repeat protein